MRDGAGHCVRAVQTGPMPATFKMPPRPESVACGPGLGLKNWRKLPYVVKEHQGSEAANLCRCQWHPSRGFRACPPEFLSKKGEENR